MSAKVIAVSSSPVHEFSKQNEPGIVLIAGIGVEGDSHAGTTVKHRSRVRQNPHQPNLRQVHLIHSELFDEVARKGFSVSPGDLGENITTCGIDLLSLPVDTILRIGDQAVVKLTGLRNPCSQIENFQHGLLAEMVEKLPDGSIERKAGVMSVVINSGTVRPRDQIAIELPDEPHLPLDRV